MTRAGDRLRILVISDHFVPENSIATQRILSWARHWPAQGATVDLVTTLKHPQNDGPLTNDGAEVRDRISLYEVPYWPTVAYPKGAPKPAVAPRPTAVAAPPSAMKRALMDLQKVSPYFLNSRTLFAFSGGARAVELVREKTFDVIVASTPLPQSHVAGWAASIVSGAPLVLDYRDQWTSPPAYGLRALARVPDRLLEAALVRRAAAVVTVSEGEARTFEKAFGRRPQVIPNGYERDEMPPPTPRRRAKGEPLRIGYFGTFNLPHSSPAVLLRVLRRCFAEGLDRAAIRVDFYGAPNSTVAAMIEHEQLGDVVHMHGNMPRDTALREQQQCDALLLFDWNDDRREGIMTGKIFECAASGRPVLVLGGNGKTVAARFIAEGGFGECLANDEAVIERWLRNAVAAGEVPATAGRDAPHLAAFERSKLARDYLDLLRSVVAQREGSTSGPLLSPRNRSRK